VRDQGAAKKNLSFRYAQDDDLVLGEVEVVCGTSRTGRRYKCGKNGMQAFLGN
jgi:hypothetical protein